MSSEGKAEQLISIFYCSKDPDVELFLKEKAIQFEKLGKSRTFFIYNEDEADKQFEILGYFTLAMQVLKIPEMFSNNSIKKLYGYGSKINNSKITELPAILIGQIAKNDLYKNEISGEEIMKYCLSTLIEGQIKLGGRLILLECKNIPYLLELYSSFGFRKIEQDYNDDDLLQLVRILQEHELIEK